MNCTDINKHIDDYLESTMSDQDQHAFELHVADCASCASKLERVKSVASGLKGLEIPEPSANFEQRMFAGVRKQYKDTRQFHFTAGFATAIAASLAIWFTSTVLVNHDLVEEKHIVSMAVNEVKTVRLLFDSHADISEVNLSIGLPDNMVVDGYPGQRELSWQTSLKKGENVLDLPIMALDPGQGELVAKLNYDGKVKVLRVVLKSSANGALFYQLEQNSVG